jgi:hypothetical protein
MKKVNLEKTEVLKITDLDNSHIIGVQCLKNKYQIVRLHRGATELNKLCYQLVYIGSSNEHSNCYGSSIESLLEGLDTLTTQVCVFDNIQEFYGWLAEMDFSEI